MKTTNPATEESEEFVETTVADLADGYRHLGEGAKVWRKKPVEERVALLSQVLEALRAARGEFARAITTEMGKPIKWSEGEIDRCLAEAEAILASAPTWLRPREVQDPTSHTPQRVQFDPLGTVAVISPWNFPVLLPLRGIIPALVAGNGVVFKPSELALRCGKRLVALFESVLTPCPVFGAYGGRELGEAVTHLPVSLIAFTGSSATGRKIAQVAAAGLKRCVLELGGLDGAIVLRDADIAASAKEIVFRNSANSGQVCAAVKRVFVERAIYPQFVEALEAEQAKLVVGDPLSRETDLGPLVSAPQLSRVESFVADAVQKGGKVVRGGKRVGERGYFYEPTLLVDVPKDANLLREEPFGPVLPVLPIDSLAEGIAQVNSSPYGLMASLFTADTARAAEIASELDVGTVCINCHLPGGPGTPFGGVKESGYGRVRTEEGLHEYTNVKLIRRVS